MINGFEFSCLTFCCIRKRNALENNFLYNLRVLLDFCIFINFGGVISPGGSLKSRKFMSAKVNLELWRWDQSRKVSLEVDAGLSESEAAHWSAHEVHWYQGLCCDCLGCLSDVVD